MQKSAQCGTLFPPIWQKEHYKIGYIRCTMRDIHNGGHGEIHNAGHWNTEECPPLCQIIQKHNGGHENVPHYV